MKRLLHATSDAYITNRIIRDSFRATDANVGRAGTLDIFKLAGESSIDLDDGPFVSGTDQPIELSRVLLKFDLDPIRQLTASILDLNSPSFRCILQLSDVLGGQTLPSDYTLILYPLSRSFDEGIGRDVAAFEDIGAANFITASDSAGAASLWFQSGANALGYVGQESIDVITGSTLLGNLFVTQSFEGGDEDLSMDVTHIISATLVGLIPEHGFRLSFSGTQETDSRTRFVKRFATRHSTNTRLRPRIAVGFNDAIQDRHTSFVFDNTGSLFLNNSIMGGLVNFTSGPAATPVTGAGSLLLTLTSGTVASGTFCSTTVVASQHAIAGNQIQGVYSATFALSQFLTGALRTEVARVHSATFTEVWGSLDGTVGYYTGSIVINESARSAFDATSHSPFKLNIINMREAYQQSQRTRFRLFAQDDGFSLKATKLPIKTPSLVFSNTHYRLRDASSDELIFDFDTATNSTLASIDSEGMFFDVFMEDLDIGRTYGIDISVTLGEMQHVFKTVGGTFRVEP